VLSNGVIRTTASIETVFRATGVDYIFESDQVKQDWDMILLQVRQRGVLLNIKDGVKSQQNGVGPFPEYQGNS
jgi:hypothetical protein